MECGGSDWWSVVDVGVRGCVEQYAGDHIHRM